MEKMNNENPDWKKTRRRIIVSGGGTGGHIFPAIAIANALTEKDPTVKILFVGAEGRMEMEKVPAAGYKILALPVRGFSRKNPFKNIAVIYRLIRSLYIARIIVKRFRPDAVVGVGGYASAPVLWAASRKRIPVVIHEMNSYAGVANKLLARRADRICVAYDDMERFFPRKKIVITGNPVRQELNDCHLQRKESLLFFNLDATKQTILVVGGSLGALTINESVESYLDRFPDDIQLIWQTGKLFYERARAQAQSRKMSNVKVFAFIQRMDLAYAAADLAISRAGAGTISELSITAKASILVPSPNVTKDHQTKNAMALVQKNAAIMIPDSEAMEKLMPEAIATVQNHGVLEPLSDNIKKMAKFHAAESIAEVIVQLINNRRT